MRVELEVYGEVTRLYLAEEGITCILFKKSVSVTLN